MTLDQRTAVDVKYDTVMDDIERKHGENVARVVHSLIQSKVHLNNLVGLITPLVSKDSEILDKLRHELVELVTIHTTTECYLLNKDFTEIRDLSEGAVEEMQKGTMQ